MDATSGNISRLQQTDLQGSRAPLIPPVVHRVGVVVFPGFQVMALAAVTVFEVANLVAMQDAYRVHLLSERGGPVRASAGMVIETKAFDAMPVETVIVGAGTTVAPMTQKLLDFIRGSTHSGLRLVALGVAAFALAEAGVLDGRRATTHWAHVRDLQRRYPNLMVDADSMFITEGDIWTSAGATAGIDLALAMVEIDLGAVTARAVRAFMMIERQRSDGQSRFRSLEVREPKSAAIRKAVEFARHNLRNVLSVDELAGVAELSPRHLSRLFVVETGQSPAKTVETFRVEAARTLMEQGDLTLSAIASEVGFVDIGRMRKSFLRSLGQTPQAIRRNRRLRDQRPWT